MYKNNFAVAIKVDGKVVRENGDTVYLPFGSEYSLVFTNLNNVKASVKIEIDGENIGEPNQELIVDANSNCDLRRYLSKDNAFKFIKRTDEISNYRGNRVCDGLIRIEFWYQLDVTVSLKTTFGPETYKWYTSPNTVLLNSTGTPVSNLYSTSCVTNNSKVCDDIGITVNGSKTNQIIDTVNNFYKECNSTVIILNLKGEIEPEKEIETPIYVKTKIECPTCGKKNKSSSNFCNRCGTALF